MEIGRLRHPLPTPLNRTRVECLSSAHGSYEDSYGDLSVTEWMALQAAGADGSTSLGSGQSSPTGQVAYCCCESRANPSENFCSYSKTPTKNCGAGLLKEVQRCVHDAWCLTKTNVCAPGEGQLPPAQPKK